MTIEVRLPTLGEDVQEVRLNRWLKQVGESVRAFEPLLEVSTDKVDSEIPAPADGILTDQLAQVGQMVTTGAIVAHLTVANETAAPPPASAPTSNGESYTGHLTPVVARMAAEHHLDLAHIPGTGRDGRVTKKDVEAYLAAQASAPAPTAPVAPPAVVAPAPVTAAPPPRVHPVESLPPPTGTTLVPHSAMRRAIADHMVRSVQTAPHVTTVFEFDMSAVLAHREAHKAAFTAQGVNLTLTAYFVAGCVKALIANPVLNARWTDDGLLMNPAVHLGIAVALEDGLIVPVIRNAQDLNLLGTARAVNDLASRARSRQLQANEVLGGTFSITNHGVSGSLFATPIINQPQTGILGVGILEKRVKAIDDMIAIRPCCYVSLTFDHRAADGAVGDAFMLSLKQTLEKWA